MATTLPTSTVPRHLSKLENCTPEMAKAQLTNLDGWRRQMGWVIARCFALASVTQKEGAALIDRDPAQVARWIAATERPQVDAILAVERLRQPLVQALSEVAGAEVEITVRLRRNG